MRLSFEKDDGGRAAAGFKGTAGDCVCRAIAIASGRPYGEVYQRLADGMGSQRQTKRMRAKHKRASARSGILTTRKWFRDYMAELGFEWVPTMGIGTGCRVHLADGELPMGRLIASVSKHYTAIIDGVIRDNHDPRRDRYVNVAPPSDMRDLQPGEHRNINGIWRLTRRCVYGYWRKTDD